MKDRRILLITILTGLAVLTIGYFLFNSSSGKKFVWRETYKGDSDQPYGTLYVRKLLESYRPEGKFYFNRNKAVYKILDSLKEIENTDYIFIGQSDFLDKKDIAAMSDFIRRGNDVFIASLETPDDLISYLYANSCNVPIQYIGDREDEITMNFYHDSLKTKDGFNYRYKVANFEYAYYWNYLNSKVFCDSTEVLVPIGYQSGERVNFFKIPHGKGNLYLHTSPMVFTNYFLRMKDKMEYVSGVFSHLNGRNIIWDEYSKIPFSGNNNVYNSPLYFILQQPSLKYAWWLMLATCLLFVLFAARRRQRIIPVLEAKSNTSLEFVTMISSLHYQNEDHLDMARKKMKYFLYFIKSKYGIQSSSFSQAHVKILSEKSKVKEAEVQNIFDRWNVIEKFGGSSIEDSRLVDLYFAIDNFYKQCR